MGSGCVNVFEEAYERWRLSDEVVECADPKKVCERYLEICDILSEENPEALFAELERAIDLLSADVNQKTLLARVYSKLASECSLLARGLDFGSDDSGASVDKLSLSNVATRAYRCLVALQVVGIMEL